MKGTSGDKLAGWILLCVFLLISGFAGGIRPFFVIGAVFCAYKAIRLCQYRV